MFKSIVVGGVIGIVGLSVPINVNAQLKAPLSPNSQLSVVSESEIAPLELQQFVQVIKQFQRIEYANQQKVAKAMKKEGLSPERFMEINESQKNWQSQSDASADEMEKFRNIVVEIKEIMSDAEEKRKKMVETQGLSLKRFLEIEEIVAKDDELQAKVQQMLGN
ncbi:MAG: DUF4168 domain-containing protein [Cyanobacteria bacterium P01_G01_bin.49]